MEYNDTEMELRVAMCTAAILSNTQVENVKDCLYQFATEVITQFSNDLRERLKKA